ncbi:hypothetical protein CCR75_000179 [Bremia lactucae]|uniref:Uncharacterized protein n=1 Tax=Bremia lactucae TaxID=4779 RepID=A0A976IFC4_BRELC|nr:hypothetical protein CCR75_000181 [Bremia lactucae]TDH70258.1 hypothetical protein CCR75_000179 [Bremia lactucae]
MKQMGQDKFYLATSRYDAGEEARTLSRKVDFPEDELPSIDEKDRMLDVITLTTKVMDEDLREALVNDETFEELDDNFVNQVAEENGVRPMRRGTITDNQDSEDDDDIRASE